MRYLIDSGRLLLCGRNRRSHSLRIAASIQYGEAQQLGDSKKVNKNADIIRQLRMQSRNDECYIIGMEKLLLHENDYVRLKASYDLLPFMTDKAEKTLNEIFQKPGLIGFETEMLMKQWKKGELKF